MKIIITGQQGLLRRPNLGLKKYAKNPVEATTALIEYDEAFTVLSATLDKLLFNKVKLVLSSSMDGLDQAVEEWAASRQVRVKRYKSKWLKDGIRNKKAGFEALAEMVAEADAALIITDKLDKRCRSIQASLKKAGKYVKVIQLEQTDHS